MDQDEFREKDRMYLKEKRAYILAGSKIIAAFLIVVFLIGAVFVIAIPKHYDLEQKKLDLMRHQFDVQAAQTNRSLQLQAANETMKAFEIAMKSPLVDLLRSPTEAGNAAKELALKLIDRVNVNLDCTPLWLCDNDNKDQESAKTAPNSSKNECQCQNTPTNIPNTGNNNKENIRYPYA